MQYRRPDPMRVEFRRTVPAALLLGLLLAMATLDVVFIGLMLPRQDAATSLARAVSAVAVFLLGRGIVIDGTHREF